MRQRGRSPGGAGRSQGRPAIDPTRCNPPPPAGEGQEAVPGARHRKMQRKGVRLSAACWREGGAAPAGRCFQLVRAAPCTAVRKARDLTPASRHPRMLAVLNRTNLMKKSCAVERPEASRERSDRRVRPVSARPRRRA